MTQSLTMTLCFALLATVSPVLGEDGAQAPSSDGPPRDSTVESLAPDLSRAIHAVENGLVPNSPEDQSKRLAELLTKVRADPQHDTLYVPAGRYHIAKEIRLLPKVNLVGDGMGRTIFYRDDPNDYLVRSGARADFGQTLIANLTFRNQLRTLLMVGVHHLHFCSVEFEGGFVRFEKASHVTLRDNYFNRNLGKAGYASSNCSHMRIIHNRFLSVENGSINLSGHKDSYVAYNQITADKLIDSGYAGVRLPNSAKNNLVEHNLIENHGRGLFVLSSSVGNVLRRNTVKSTTYQGVFIQSSDNVLEENTIIDAGNEGIYVVDATADSSPTPSLANNNRIRSNVIYDTRGHNSDRFVGLLIKGAHNVVEGNRVSTAHGRELKSINEDGGNRDLGNEVLRTPPSSPRFGTGE